MSEVSTGSVSVSITRGITQTTIGATKVVGNAVFEMGKAAYHAGAEAVHYCIDKYNQMMREIEETNQKIKWFEAQEFSSPRSMVNYAKDLQNSVKNNPAFIQFANEVQIDDTDRLAGLVASEHSPYKDIIQDEILSNSNQNFIKSIENSGKNLAYNQFNFVNKVLETAAMATGFSFGKEISRKTKSKLEIAFKDEQNRVFTAYSRIGKDGNPDLVLDLEGFSCDEKACTNKMNEIVAYLRESGVNFDYKRLKHNQPEGVLRKMLNKAKKKKPVKNHSALKSYLTETNDQNQLIKKQKNGK